MSIYSAQRSISGEATELLKEIDRLGFLIRLQLNPKEQPDQEIEKLIMLIPLQTNLPTLDPLRASLEQLTRSTQALLKKEWEKVKTEVRTGRVPK